MDLIASFTVNHLLLEPGVYVSRQDADPSTGAVITTFDLRLTAPNREPVMDTAAVHALEHLGATFLRNAAHHRGGQDDRGPRPHHHPPQPHDAGHARVHSCHS